METLERAEQEIETLRDELKREQELRKGLEKRVTAKDREFQQERDVWRREKRKLNTQIVALRKSEHHLHHRQQHRRL